MGGVEHGDAVAEHIVQCGRTVPRLTTIGGMIEDALERILDQVAGRCERFGIADELNREDTVRRRIHV